MMASTSRAVSQGLSGARIREHESPVNPLAVAKCKLLTSVNPSELPGPSTEGL